MYTNNPPAGAFRGFGVTQTCFGAELNLDLLAEMVGISPWEIRYRNAVRPGQVLPNGQIADASTGIAETLEAVKEIYEQAPYAGIACAMKNAGVGVGLPDWGRCRLLVQDKMVQIHAGASCIGQGLGNIFSGLFGGIPATGAIARTAANVRNGGRTPIAGIMHCITLTIILLVLMPLAALIPMTTLAAVLLMVAANMADWSSFFRLCKTAPKSDIIVLVATFFLTVFFDLVVAIEIGVVLAALLFMKRMAETADIKAWKYTDSPDITPGEAEKLRDIPHSISVFEICGPMFFAAADQIVNINSHHHTKVVVIRMRSVPAIDASAMHSLHELATRAKRKNITLVFSHVNEQPMHVMEKDGFVELIGKENFHKNIVDALDYAESLVK